VEQATQACRLQHFTGGGGASDALQPTTAGAHNAIRAIFTLNGVSAPALNTIWMPVVEGVAVSSYTPEVAMAQPTPVLPFGNLLQLFPLGQSIALSCVAQSPFGALWFPVIDVLDVIMPGQPVCSVPPAGPIGVQVESDGLWLRFGNSGNPAFSLQAQFAPAYPGYMGVLQILNGRRWYAMEDGSEMVTQDTQGGWMLDYQSTDFDFLISPPVYCTAAAPGVLTPFRDSPGSPLDSHLSATSFNVDEQFVTFLMFNGGSTPHGDPDHIWLAVAGFNWGWNAVATWADEGGWSLTSAQAQTVQPVPGGVLPPPSWFGTVPLDTPLR
jgi:hypothetical protein